MFRLQEREKRRRRVLIEQMKAHEAQEVRKTNSTNVGNVRFSTICYFRGPGCCSQFFAVKLFGWDVGSVYPVLIESFRFQDEDEYEI